LLTVNDRRKRKSAKVGGRASRAKPVKTGLLRKPLPAIAHDESEVKLRMALLDMIRFYDRVSGVAHTGTGWTVGDVLRLKEIRALCFGEPV
jgi:hypothetical protein